MTSCFFASDLHGSVDRYEKLFGAIRAERPRAVFLGGDLLPSGAFAGVGLPRNVDDFVADFLAAGFGELRRELGPDYPSVCLILGNDDPRFEEAAVLDAATQGIWHYVHNRRVEIGAHELYGYAKVPPSPFRLKDWEAYDVSRYVDPGCVSPEQGVRTIPVAEHLIRYGSIKQDLDQLTGDADLSGAIFLFHSPPYETALDRAALDGKMVDHVPLDVHVGSIAIRRFVEERQPLVTLHGHIHESARITGSWRDRIGRTEMLSAAHDGDELALVRLSLEDPAAATRELI